jgi:hypothetical protein
LTRRRLVLRCWSSRPNNVVCSAPSSAAGPCAPAADLPTTGPSCPGAAPCGGAPFALLPLPHVRCRTATRRPSQAAAQRIRQFLQVLQEQWLCNLFSSVLHFLFFSFILPSVLYIRGKTGENKEMEWVLLRPFSVSFSSICIFLSVHSFEATDGIAVV